MSGPKVGDFDSNGVTIRYAMQGSGEPVILLHGFMFGMDAHWIDSGWLSALSQDYQAIAMDLRGHGHSDKPHEAERYGLEMPKDILRLMDHLGIQHANIVGYSLGGILALKLLDLAPERLLSIAAGGAGWMEPADIQYQTFIQSAAMLEQVRPGELLSDHFWPDKMRRPPMPIQQIVDANDPAALAAAARGMVNVTLTEKVLRSNRVPLLVVFGANDPIKASGAAMDGVARNFTMTVIPGLDHSSLAAAEEFKTAIRDFIAKPRRQ